MRTTLLRTALGLLLATSACGGGDEPTSTSTSSGAEAESAPLPPLPTDLVSPPVAWSEMSMDARGEWMDQHVVPAMRTLFQGYDAGRYANLDCATCHGPNARAEHFEMPAASLPVLPRPGTPEWEEMTVEAPRAFGFMAERVVPAMATLLGESPYDPATQQGFGCFECHTMRQ